MKRLLKIVAFLTAILVTVGGVYYAYSTFVEYRQRLAIEESKKQETGREEQRRIEVAKERNRRIAAQAEAPSVAPRRSKPSSAIISQLEFSPDGKFVAAAIHHQTTGELAVWPARGGATLVRRKFDFATDLSFAWKDPTRLVAQSSVWQISKNKGYWELAENNPSPYVYQGGHTKQFTVDRSQVFPKQDIRLQIENYPVEQGEGTTTHSRLAAYSLETGEPLPLPSNLSSLNGTSIDLKAVKPLARWGKAPLRLARWIERDDMRATNPKEHSKLEVWNARSKKRLWTKSFPVYAGTLLVGSQGNFVIAAGTPYSAAHKHLSDGIEVYDSSHGKLLAKKRVQGMQIKSCFLSPDGSLLAVAVHALKSTPSRSLQSVLILDARTLRTPKQIALSHSGSFPPVLAFSADNARLAIAQGSTIHILDWRNVTQLNKNTAQQAWL